MWQEVEEELLEAIVGKCDGAVKEFLSEWQREPMWPIDGYGAREERRGARGSSSRDRQPTR